MPLVRICYQTIEFGNTDIHLRTLRDNQQYADPDGEAERLGISSATWPLFGVIWPSSKVLAHLMFDYEVKGKRILEVGCGIALASLVLNHHREDITATDYHPEVEAFLVQNTQLNDDKDIPFVRTSWEELESELGLFDMIIGSDLLYQRDHAKLLADFIDQHAKAHCEVIIVDPGRGHQSHFSKRMVNLGYTHTQTKPENTDYLTAPFKGKILRYQR
ncbi:MAG: histidine kinase [Epsilonproteobacteria bacterium]|nr:histidine kinase [Campylobacterota bacterium]